MELCAVRYAQDRFWARVRKSDGCWLWTGQTNRNGYGVFAMRREKHLAHRVSWMLAHGRLDDKTFVLHRCDVPGCVRPDHLFLGTQADNMADCKAKGRWPRGATHGTRTHPEAFLRGEDCSWRKLTEAQVREIRSRYQPCVVTQQALADEYGVSRGTVRDILRRRIWKHV